MKLVAALTLISLATATPLAKRDRPQSVATEPPRCPGDDFQGCNLDGTKLACTGGEASIFTCEGGCILNCPDPEAPCEAPTCDAEEPAEVPW